MPRDQFRFRRLNSEEQWREFPEAPDARIAIRGRWSIEDAVDSSRLQGIDAGLWDP